MVLSDKQILEIREHLERAQNPVFFYDNDADGLCSYVMLRKFIDRGKGVAVRSHPDVDERYAKRVQELSGDYIFVLDRPMLGEKFVSEIKSLGLPIVWIDHHEVEDEKLDYDALYRYNTLDGKNGSNEPVAYWAYKISGRKEDVWVALMGCIADHYLPDFVSEFSERYGEYWTKEKIEKPFDAYYKTEIGRLGQVVGFGLKDSITHVVQMQNFLVQCKGPSDLFLEIEGSKAFAKKYRDLKKKYDSLVTKAKQGAGDDIVFFSYGGDMSISSEISNELSYLYPGRKILVAYSSGPLTNISMRGDNVKGLIDGLLGGFENATGGGHTNAVGLRIQSKDLERFKKEVEEKILYDKDKRNKN